MKNGWMFLHKEVDVNNLNSLYYMNKAVQFVKDGQVSEKLRVYCCSHIYWEVFGCVGDDAEKNKLIRNIERTKNEIEDRL